ncbi:MAG: late competence development ComFB family protein [Oscillibacter sp.]|nr:late competence development ComFB family protein [Oscillibacter sp.]
MLVINIMEALVEEKAPRYIRMFGLCSCARCAADVKALTLTNLQPSYIVRRRAEAHAMLTVYESRYNSTIFAQLTRACKVVMDNPRHDPDKPML